MKQNLRVLTTAIIVIFLATSFGCGGKQKAKVKPNEVEISGDLSDYLQVVDNEYEVIDNGHGGNLSIKIKAIKQLSSDELLNNDFDLSVSLLDENGTPVSGTGEFKIETASLDKLKSLLRKGTGEEVIPFEALMFDYKAKEHAEKSKKFSVSSSMDEKKNKPASESSKDIILSKKDTAKTSEIIFIVKNVTEPKIDRRSLTKPEDNEKYISVQIWAKNISKSEITLSQDDFKLFDQDDAEYIEKDCIGGIEKRKEPLFFKTQGFSSFKIKPNEAKSGWITFTTNIKSKPIKLTHKKITIKL